MQEDTEMEKRLRKSKDKKLWGVCGGLAEYFDIDPAFVRLCIILLTVFGVIPGVIIYLAAAIAMPPEDCMAASFSKYDDRDDISGLKDAKIPPDEDAFGANTVHFSPRG